MSAVDHSCLQRLYEQKQWALLLETLEAFPSVERDLSQLGFFEGVALARLGFPELSLTAFAEALSANPRSTPLRLAAVEALQACGDWSVSLQLLQQRDAQELAESAKGQLLIARAYVRMGQLAEAEQIIADLQQAADVDLVGLGVVLVDLHLAFGDHKQAQFCWKRLHDLGSRSIDVLLTEVRMLAAQWSRESRKQLLDLTQVHSDEPLLALHASRILRHHLLVEEARSVLNAAIQSHGFRGDLAEAWIALLVAQGELDELRQCLALAPITKRPLNHQLLIAECLLRALRPAEACRVLESMPQDLETLSLLSDCYRRLGDYPKALAAITKLVGLSPNSPDLQLQRSYQLLAMGQWAEAWPLYEQRFAIQGAGSFLAPGMYPRNVWEQPHGRSVLVFGEQGFGDTLMHASMLQELADVARDLTVIVQPRLLPLLSCSFPSLQITTGVSQERFEAMDSCYGIGSLGRFFRPQPSDCPGDPFLHPPAEFVSSWSERLQRLSGSLNVGIAWRGGGELGESRRRSLSLESLAPLLVTPNVNWINLQYRHSADELEAINVSHGVHIHHFDGVTDDLLETAALTKALDLVITVQQTALHIAGGVGTQAWVMVPFAPEWRYGIQGAEMPWYSSVELFRQAVLSDWELPIEQIRERLQGFLDRQVVQNGAIS